MHVPQYTIRNVSDSVDRELRDRARRNGKSLNETTLEVIKRSRIRIPWMMTYGSRHRD